MLYSTHFTHCVNADANILPKAAPFAKNHPVNLFPALPLARVERMSQSRTMLSNETTRRHFGSGKLCQLCEGMANYGNRGNSWKLVLHLRCYGRPFTSSISCRLFIFCRRWRIRSRPGMTRSYQGCVSCIMLKWLCTFMHFQYPSITLMLHMLHHMISYGNHVKSSWIFLGVGIRVTAKRSDSRAGSFWEKGGRNAFDGVGPVNRWQTGVV